MHAACLTCPCCMHLRIWLHVSITPMTILRLPWGHDQCLQAAFPSWEMMWNPSLSLRLQSQLCTTSCHQSWRDDSSNPMGLSSWYYHHGIIIMPPILSSGISESHYWTIHVHEVNDRTTVTESWQIRVLSLSHPRALFQHLLDIPPAMLVLVPEGTGHFLVACQLLLVAKTIESIHARSTLLSQRWGLY